MKVKSRVGGKGLLIQGGFVVPKLGEIFDMTDKDAEKHITEKNVEAVTR